MPAAEKHLTYVLSLSRSLMFSFPALAVDIVSCQVDGILLKLPRTSPSTLSPADHPVHGEYDFLKVWDFDMVVAEVTFRGSIKQCVVVRIPSFVPLFILKHRVIFGLVPVIYQAPRV